MTLTFDFKCKIFDLLYSRKICSYCHKMKNIHIDWTLGLKCRHQFLTLGLFGRRVIVVTCVCPSVRPSVGADESPWPCGTPSWYTPLSWIILSKQKNLRLFSSQYNCVFLWDVRLCMVCLLAEAPLDDDYSLWILAQTSMSQLTVQQSYLLCWELLPDRNRKSMGLWYWELMSHPDPVVLPVGTLHSLEWFWVSRRIFVYSHHNTIVFLTLGLFGRRVIVVTCVCPSVRLSVCSHHPC